MQHMDQSTKFRKQTHKLKTNKIKSKDPDNIVFPQDVYDWWFYELESYNSEKTVKSRVLVTKQLKVR